MKRRYSHEGFCVVGRRIRQARALRARLELLEDRVMLTGSGTWSGFSPTPFAPRFGAPVVSIGPIEVNGVFKTLESAYIFGGTDGSTTRSDTVAIAEQPVLSTLLTPPTSPPARHDHSAAAFNDKMYIFGGVSASGATLNDIWAFDPATDTWQQQPSLSSPQTWPGAFNAVASVIGQEIILYGGSISSTKAADAFAYGYNTATGAWTKFAANPLGSDTSPTVGTFNNEMYVFSSTSSTIEVFDPASNTWSAINPSGAGPTPHALAAGSSLSSLFLLTGGQGNTLGDTWLFNFTTNTWVQVAGYPESKAADMGATAFFNFGVADFVTTGGESLAANAPAGTLITDLTFGRFQSPGGGVTSLDNFPAGLPGEVVPHMVVAENGGSVTYALNFFNPTSGNVTIPLSSSDPSVATVSPSQIVAAPGQTNQSLITVTGAGNATLTGDTPFFIQYGPLVSSDISLNGLTEDLPVIARPFAPFVVGTAGSFQVTSRYTASLASGMLPSTLKFDAASQTIIGTPDPLTAGTYPLTFSNALFGEAAKTKITLNLVVLAPANPAPTVSTISPTAVTAGSPDVLLTVMGTNFLNSSVVNVNGVPLATTFVSDTQLQATVPSVDLKAPGTIAITVFNPVPGGGASLAQSLTVTPVVQAPFITQQPKSQAVASGGSVTFTAAAGGTPNPTVQWLMSTDNGATFTVIAGATSPTFALPNTILAENGDQFRAQFTNSSGQILTIPAVLTVGIAPTVTLQPVSRSVSNGKFFSFTATASGTPTPSIVWLSSTDQGRTFNPVPGATSTTITGNAIPSLAGAEFVALFTNEVGQTGSQVAILTLKKFAPVIVTQPSNVSVKQGETVLFTVSALADPAATIHWQVAQNGSDKFTNVAKAHSRTLAFKATAAENGQRYRAVLKNKFGTVLSAAARLTVL